MKAKRIAVTIVFCLITVVLCGCNLFKVVDTTSIATVNGDDVTLNEYKYHLAIVKEQLLQSTNPQAQGHDFWNSTEIEGKKAGDFVKDTALDNMVTTTVVAQKAKEAGHNVSGTEATQFINNAKKQLSSIIDKYKVPEEGVTAALEKEYLISKLFAEYREDGKIDISDSAVVEYYKSNYRTVKHILFTTVDPATGETKRTDEEAKQLAEDTLAKLSGGSDFDALMSSLSEDPGSVSQPGGYTFTQDGMMVAEFETAAFQLNEGEISQPVKTSFGYHILKREPLISYEEYLSQAASEEEKQYIIETLKYYLEIAEEKKFADEWTAQAEIKMNDSEFEKIKVN